MRFYSESEENMRATSFVPTLSRASLVHKSARVRTACRLREATARSGARLTDHSWTKRSLWSLTSKNQREKPRSTRLVHLRRAPNLTTPTCRTLSNERYRFK